MSRAEDIKPYLDEWQKGLDEGYDKPPDVPESERGNLQPLNIISENTEYPFWSITENRLVSPAEAIAS